MRVSICIPSFKRAALLHRTLNSIERQKFKDYEIIVCEDGDDGGETKETCECHGVRYLQRKHRPDEVFSSPAVPMNMMFRAAKGDVILINHAECEHSYDEVIDRLTLWPANDAKFVSFASVQALNQDGTFREWYIHPEQCRRPFHFCMAVRRSVVYDLRGIDEDYTGYGFEDDDFAFRLRAAGMEFVFVGPEHVLVSHLWHPKGKYEENSMHELYKRKVEQFNKGEIGIARNIDRDWGIG